jgi:aminoglycoside phosphotransferase family enzyme
MDIVTALKEGLVEGINDKPERHVETVMSDVLIYSDSVLKYYKEREGVFVDMCNPVERKRFYFDDYSWNKSVSPKIHLALHGVDRSSRGKYRLAEPEDSSIWLIEMKRIEDADTLYKRLLDNTATIEDVSSFAATQTKALEQLTKDYLKESSDVLQYGLQKLWEMRIDNDLRTFGKSFGKEIPTELTDKRIDKLLDYFMASEFLQSLNETDASILIDNHAGNVVFHEDRPQFIDILLPKREWRVLDHHNNIARIAACVRVLGNDELADAMYETYSKYHTLAPREIYDFEEAYNAFIKGYYYTYLKKPEIAGKYFAFADKTLERL